jgi:putative ABC transport system permease protein
VAGAATGVVALTMVTLVARDDLLANAGLVIDAVPTPGEYPLLAAVLFLGSLAGCIPGWVAYRRSLADGLQVRT